MPKIKELKHCQLIWSDDDHGGCRAPPFLSSSLIGHRFKFNKACRVYDCHCRNFCININAILSRLHCNLSFEFQIRMGYRTNLYTFSLEAPLCPPFRKFVS